MLLRNRLSRTDPCGAALSRVRTYQSGDYAVDRPFCRRLADESGDLCLGAAPYVPVYWQVCFGQEAAACAIVWGCGGNPYDLDLFSNNIRIMREDKEMSDFDSNIPEEYRPISMWGYLGYEILFSIPCVGIILLIVFSLGGTRNVNLKNFARSYFCVFIIVAVLLVLMMILGGGMAALEGMSRNY